MRPIWKGSISFGLVYIPIAVYPATREEKLSFRQLRRSAERTRCQSCRRIAARLAEFPLDHSRYPCVGR